MILRGRGSSPHSINGTSICDRPIRTLSIFKKPFVYTCNLGDPGGSIIDSLYKHHRAGNIIYAVTVFDTWLIKVAVFKDSSAITDGE
jgi:hypothetical protein